MLFELPTKLNIGGTDYAIRSDYRAVLEICTALSDTELSDEEKAIVTLVIFYPDFEQMPPEDLQEALEKCFAFIDHGQGAPGKSAPRLMDWEKDFPYIIAPVNRVVGHEIRADNHFHWWSFLAAYMEIGECTFAQIVHIRDQQHKGKTLEKFDRDWYRQNRDLVDLKTKITSAEEEVFKQWGGGSGA